MVDHQGASLGTSQGAIGTQHDGTQVIVIPHTTKHHVRAKGCFTRCGGAGVARELGAPIFGLGRVAVVNGDVVTGERQVACHGVTHDTEANESHFGGGAGFVGFGVGAGHG